jgi:hypothetical protein
MLEVLHYARFIGFFANLAYFCTIEEVAQNLPQTGLQVIDFAGDRERLKRLPR